MNSTAVLETDVTFHETEHGALTATLYGPAGAAIAAVVDLHGGAWTSGDRTMNVAVSRGDAECLPPILVIQGTNDANLTPDMQERLVAAYRGRGGEAELAVYEGEPHGFIGAAPDSAASLDALERITAFIRREAAKA